MHCGVYTIRKSKTQGSKNIKVMGKKWKYTLKRFLSSMRICIISLDIVNKP